MRDVAAHTGLSVKDVAVRFGGLRALSGVSLDVSDRQVRGLVGPNGAGKTTLLRVIAGEVRPDSGRILLGGLDLRRVPAHGRARLGVRRTFQDLDLFPRLTVAQNIALAAHATRSQAYRRHSAEAKSLRHAVHQIASLLGIEPFLDLYPNAIPFGTRRLVEVARASVGRPRILLLDEPAAGLNSVESGHLRQALRLIAREWRSLDGILLIEHNIVLVTDVCDQVTILSEGEMIAEGKPDIALRTPEVRKAYLGNVEGK